MLLKECVSIIKSPSWNNNRHATGVKFFLHFYASCAPEAGSVGKSTHPGCRKLNLSFLRLNFAVLFNFSFRTAQVPVKSKHDTGGFINFFWSTCTDFKRLHSSVRDLCRTDLRTKKSQTRVSLPCPFVANISDYLPPLVAFTFRSLCQMA